MFESSGYLVRSQVGEALHRGVGGQGEEEGGGGRREGREGGREGGEEGESSHGLSVLRGALS